MFTTAEIMSIADDLKSIGIKSSIEKTTAILNAIIIQRNTNKYWDKIILENEYTFFTVEGLKTQVSNWFKKEPFQEKSKIAAIADALDKLGFEMASMQANKLRDYQEHYNYNSNIRDAGIRDATINYDAAIRILTSNNLINQDLLADILLEENKDLSKSDINLIKALTIKINKKCEWKVVVNNLINSGETFAKSAHQLSSIFYRGCDKGNKDDTRIDRICSVLKERGFFEHANKIVKLQDEYPGSKKKDNRLLSEQSNNEDDHTPDGDSGNVIQIGVKRTNLLVSEEDEEELIVNSFSNESNSSSSSKVAKTSNGANVGSNKANLENQHNDIEQGKQ